MRYKRLKFVCDPSITKVILLEEQITCSSVSMILLEEILWIVVLITFRTSF